MGTWEILARQTQFALQTTRLLVCGLRESERLPHGKLPCCVFFWFCWKGARAGAVFFTRCVIGVYHRCVYCGKQCRFLLFGFVGLF